jgi:hypothetical protein
MRPSASLLPLLIFFVVSVTCLVSASFTPKDLLSAARAGPAIPNANGTFAVYTQSSYSFDNDTQSGGLFLLPLTSKKTSAEFIVNDTSASSPAWLDNTTLLYISTQHGESTLRTYNTDTEKDNKVHTFHGAIGDLKTIVVGKTTIRFAFSAKVNQHGEMLRANETDIPQALVYDRLWVRHWDEWVTSNKNSIFSGTLTLKHDQYVIDESPRNMLNSTEELHDLECPIPPWGGAEDFSVSTSLLAFVAKDPHLNPATNTAAHVYVVKYDDGRYLEKVNRGPGASSAPVWSPDGQFLAYLEMRVRGYEADRYSTLNCADYRSKTSGVQMGNSRIYISHRTLGSQSVFNPVESRW